MKIPTEPYNKQATKIFFPCVIVTVDNDNVNEMIRTHDALKSILDSGKLSIILASLADENLSPENM